MNGHALLMIGLLFCAAGLLFGLCDLRAVEEHAGSSHHARNLRTDLRDLQERIWSTQGKFILLLWAFIAVIIGLYFGVSGAPVPPRKIRSRWHCRLSSGFSLVGIAGSYGVAWFGIRVNTFANSRTSFAALRSKPHAIYAIPLKAGMSIGMLLISVELLIMLFIFLFIPRDYAGPCFIGHRRRYPSAPRPCVSPAVTSRKIAIVGADLMKIVFKIKEDDARNPGVTCRLHR